MENKEEKKKKKEEEEAEAEMKEIVFFWPSLLMATSRLVMVLRCVLARSRPFHLLPLILHGAALLSPSSLSCPILLIDWASE